MSLRLRHWLLEHLEADVEPSTPSGCLVVLCAAVGSSVEEQARVIGVSARRLRAVGDGRLSLTPAESDRLGRWLLCAWWRTTWRLGLHQATTGAARHGARLAARGLHIPEDWTVDWLQSQHGRPEVLSDQLPDGPRVGRLTDDEATGIREAYQEGATMSEIAVGMRVAVSTVSRVVRGLTHAHRGR